MPTTAESWMIYQGTGLPAAAPPRLPDPPYWRRFTRQLPEGVVPYVPDSFDQNRLNELNRGATFQAGEKEKMLVNVALLLRRPLLVTGKPGTGKSSLAYAVAYELSLGRVLHWSITSRSNLTEALYRYDAIGRLQEAARKSAGPHPKGKGIDSFRQPEISHFLRLGPLGTALLPCDHPQVLLIDEIDKSNIDLPNDLLHIFETGEYEIPELARLPENQSQVDISAHEGRQTAHIVRGRVVCTNFPFVVITSNGERELPPPFLRRCVRLDVDRPGKKLLTQIVEQHFSADDKAAGRDPVQAAAGREKIVDDFLERRQSGDLANDQLLNAIYLLNQGVNLNTPLESAESTAAAPDRQALADVILRYLGAAGL